MNNFNTQQQAHYEKLIEMREYFWSIDDHEMAEVISKKIIQFIYSV